MNINRIHTEPLIKALLLWSGYAHFGYENEWMDIHEKNYHRNWCLFDPFPLTSTLLFISFSCSQLQLSSLNDGLVCEFFLLPLLIKNEVSGYLLMLMMMVGNSERVLVDLCWTNGRITSPYNTIFNANVSLQ